MAPFKTFTVASHVPRRFECYVRLSHPDNDGWLPRYVAVPLKEILGAHTPRDSNCWFGVWRGWGLTYRPEVPKTIYLDTGSREWDLFKGPLAALDRSFFLGMDIRANLVWSEDTSWFLATCIDLDRTFVGCTRTVLSDILNDRRLDAVEVRSDDSSIAE
ncbi:MAG: hypothetical protein OXH75_25475 [Acidobacteria bacterium]|nr:hypothetical protein [Acidobacteriota bacterium]